MTAFKPETEAKIGRLYQLLSECAALGAACPSTDEIKQRFGCGSPGTVVRWLDALKEGGLIDVETGHHARRITIIATGARTAPIPLSKTALARNAPYRPQSHRGQERGSKTALAPDLSAADGVPRPLSREEERAQSRQERARLRFLLDRIRVIGPARSCRAIVTVPILQPLDNATLDRARAGDMTIYCGQPSEPGCSHCAAHKRAFLRRCPLTPARGHPVPTDPAERAFYRKCRNEGLNHMQAISRVNTMRGGHVTRNG